MERDATLATAAATTSSRPIANDISPHLLVAETALMFSNAPPKLTAAEVEDHALAAELRQAMKDPKSQLAMHYQPLVNSTDGRLVGFEALLRWTTQDGRQVDPMRIVDLAVRHDMAEALDLWVLQAALCSADEWIQSKSKLIIAVNMTSALLSSPFCQRIVQGLLRRNGVAPSNLCIEVTEVLMLNDQTTANLLALRSIGVKLAIDDFGTGLSALSRLMDLPVDSIKLDRSFILGRTLSAQDEDFLAAMVQMGHARGATVTIEGISRAEDVALAQRIGCDTCQGFWFARAMDSEQADAMVIATILPWHAPIGQHP